MGLLGPPSTSEWWEVTNRGCLGRTEVQLAQLVLDAAAALRTVEQRLLDGDTLRQAMTPPPPPEAASIQLARAVQSGGGSQLEVLTLSSNALPVLDWSGRSPALSLAGLRLYDRDAVLLSELLARNTSLVSLNLSQCRMTEAGTLSLAQAFFTSKPKHLTELRLPDNRLRVSGCHLLLDALEAAECCITTLDLSANELCGGTVAEDHSFGLIKGTTARLSEHGQLCRLDSDGLCSAGPRMEPHSGCYRIELEVLQATDGDGAYVGVIRPDANKSSYPGSDDKGVGWRAKGGVRHVHNTVDLGSAIAGWGQGDRVGLMLDTHTNELTFYKNGKAFEQRYTLQMDGALYFAVGRYYGSYVVRCLYVHQQGGNEEMDYSALGRICTLLSAPSNQLKELRVANNQLTGVSKFHGGRRNERGLAQLLHAVASPECKLTYLDASGNGLSAEDAGALVALALAPAAPIRLLKVHQWLVPIKQLASDEDLDLHSQAMVDEDAVLLAQLLETRSHLTRLDLRDNRLSTQGVTALAAAIVHSKTSLRSPAISLRWLSVASNRLGALAASSLLQGLASAASTLQLEALDLSDNPLTEGPSNAFDTRAIVALESLLVAPGCALRSIGLGGTQLCGRDGDAGYVGDGITIFCSALKRSRAPIEQVRLSGNSMRDTEGAVLAAALTERASAGQGRIAFDLSTNSLSTARLGDLAELCTLTAAFQKPLCERTFVGFDKCVYGAATADDAIFLAHGSGPIIKVCLREWKELGRFEGHSDDTNCLTLHDTLHDRYLLSGSDDYTVKVWSTAISAAGEGSCIATLTGHEARVWCIVTTEDTIYSCSADKSIIAWSLSDAQSGIVTQTARLTHHTDVVYAVRVAFGSLFSSSADKTIKRYDLTRDSASGRRPHPMTLSWEAHAHSITCLAPAEKLNLLCSGAEDGRISLWRVHGDTATCTGTLTARLHGSRGASSNLAVYALAVSPVNGDVLFAGGADYRVHMYDLVLQTLLHTLTGHASTVRALCFTPSGDKLCSSGGDFNLLVWRVMDGHEGRRPPPRGAGEEAEQDADAPIEQVQHVEEQQD